MHIFAYSVCSKFLSLKTLYVHCLPITTWWSQLNHNDNHPEILHSSEKVYLCVSYGAPKTAIISLHVTEFAVWFS